MFNGGMFVVSLKDIVLERSTIQPKLNPPAGLSRLILPVTLRGYYELSYYLLAKVFSRQCG